MLIENLIFLYHGRGHSLQGTVPNTGNPLTGLIVVIILIALGVGLWVLFARKKSI